MTQDEMKAAAMLSRNAARGQHNLLKDKFKAASDEAAKELALEELFLWRQIEVGFDSALGALVQLEDLQCRIKLRGC